MKKIFLTCALALFLAACAYGRTPVINTANIDQIDFSQIDSMKRGRDCSWGVLFLGPFGTQKVTNAVRRAGISKVEVVDYDIRSWILFARSCVEVYGR